MGRVTSEMGSTDLLVGPAVVVDDHVYSGGPASGIHGIVEQIEAAEIPILKLSSLPSLDQIRHWGGFSMIILDWELFPANGDDAPLPPGLDIPNDLRQDNDERVCTFIQALLDELYCPIFIVSSKRLEEIDQALTDHLKGHETQWRARVFINSKKDSQENFLDSLTSWIQSHPAIYALRSWERGYTKAKHALFRDFQGSSVMWPKVLWSAYDADSVNQSFELAETLNRNLLHRMDPLVFDSEILTAAAGELDRKSLHDVLHGQAVIPEENLPSDVLMPGDFFYEEDDAESPARIVINLTAACDLVPRKGMSRDSLKLRLVEARLVKDLSKKRDKLEAFLDRERSTSQVLHHLTRGGVPYEVIFSTHYESTWGAMASIRRGRLLPPYITQLQQKFALYLMRPGLPVLPLEFYLDPPAPPAPPQAMPSGK